MRRRSIVSVLIAVALAACGTPSLRPAGMPARTFEGNVLTSPAKPAGSFRLDKSFVPVGTLEFAIQGKTWVERRMYAKVDGARRVRQLIVFQFEEVIDGSDFQFVYRPTPPQSLGPEIYKYSAIVVDTEAAVRRNPFNETARTIAHLRARGLFPPPKWKMARFARVTDPDGRSELIVFYLEAAARNFAEFDRAELERDGAATLHDAERARLLQRARTVIHGF